MKFRVERYNILFVRCYLDKEKVELEIWDDDSLGIRGNYRGIILGLG